MRPTQHRPTHGRRPTSRKPAHAGTLAKTLSRYQKIALTLHVLFLQTTTLQRNPQIFLLFTIARPSTIPTCAGMASGGTRAYTGHTGPTLTNLRGRRSPRVRREMMGGDCMSQDTVEGPLHDGGHPIAMAMMFR